MRLKSYHFFCCFLLFLPFTQALTINLFFPLKISELLLVPLILFFIFQKLDRNFFVVLRKIEMLYFFLGIVTISFLVNVFWSYDYALKEIPFRINKIADSALRLIYIYLNVLAFVMAIYHFGNRKYGVFKFWIYGAMFAALYGWYLFISTWFGFPYLKLFGMEENPSDHHGYCPFRNI